MTDHTLAEKLVSITGDDFFVRDAASGDKVAKCVGFETTMGVAGPSRQGLGLASLTRCVRAHQRAATNRSMAAAACVRACFTVNECDTTARGAVRWVCC